MCATGASTLRTTTANRTLIKKKKKGNQKTFIVRSNPVHCNGNWLRLKKTLLIIYNIVVMLRSFWLCLIKCVTIPRGRQPEWWVMHFLRQSPKDRSINIVKMSTMTHLNLGEMKMTIQFLPKKFLSWFKIQTKRKITMKWWFRWTQTHKSKHSLTFLLLFSHSMNLW